MPLDALEGFTIGVTADRRWEQQADLLLRRGAEVLHGATMTTRYLDESCALQRATAAVSRGVDYTVVTTGIGVRAWFEAAESHGGADELRSAIDGSRILCRGPKAAAALQVAGVTSPPVAEAESLGDLLGPGALAALAGARVAFQHHGATDAHWTRLLQGSGATVVEVPVYRWDLPDSDDAALRLVRATCEGRVDAVTFTSAPAVTNLLHIAARHDLDGALLESFNGGAVVAACVGPLCAAGARDDGITAPVAPDVGRLGLMVRAVTEALGTRTRRWRAGDRDVVLQGRALAVDATTVRLSHAERRLLSALAERPGVVVAKTALARRASTTPRAVEAGIGRLRRRTGSGPELIQTVPGRGYRLRCP